MTQLCGATESFARWGSLSAHLLVRVSQLGTGLAIWRERTATASNTVVVAETSMHKPLHRQVPSRLFLNLCTLPRLRHLAVVFQLAATPYEPSAQDQGCGLEQTRPLRPARPDISCVQTPQPEVAWIVCPRPRCRRMPPSIFARSIFPA
jgi:hypothetical protein